jgi:hypothetical protein
MAAIGGLVIYDEVTVTPTVAQVEAADTVLAKVSVPADAIILDVLVYATDMDTNGAPTLALDVGDSAGPATPDDNRLVAAFNQDSGADTIHCTNRCCNGRSRYSEVGCYLRQAIKLRVLIRSLIRLRQPSGGGWRKTFAIGVDVCLANSTDAG